MNNVPRIRESSNRKNSQLNYNRREMLGVCNKCFLKKFDIFRKKLTT